MASKRARCGSPKHRGSTGPVALAVAILGTLSCGDSHTAPLPPAEPTSLSVIPATVELEALGATAQLSAEVRDQRGWAVPDAVVTWSSGDPLVAAVDASGLVTATGNGSTAITASSGSLSGSASVSVRPPPVPPEPVGTMPDQALETGQTATVAASVYFSDPDGGALSYAAESSDPGVVTAEVSGSELTVEPTGPGIAAVTVTATDPDGLSAVQRFGVVVSGSVEDDFESEASLNDWEGENADIAVTDGALAITNQTEGRLGLAKRREMPTLNDWTIQARMSRTTRRARPGVVSLTGHGRFTAVRLVLRTLDDDDRDRGGVADAADATRNYEFAVFDGERGEWVLVRNLSGRSQLVAEEPGRYTEIAFGHEGKDFVAYAGDNGEEELFRFDLTTTSLEDVALGEILSDVTGVWLANQGAAGSTALHDRVRVTGTGSDATPPDEAEIEDAPDEAIRTTGVELPVASVTVSPSSDTLAVGDTLRLSAEAYDADGRALSGAEFSWSSSNRAVATVDSSGLVTASGDGEAIITAMSGAASGTATVTVPATPPEPVGSIPDQTIEQGQTVTIDPSAYFRDRSGYGLTYQVESSDETVAVPWKTGNDVTVAGIGPGTATVTVTANDAAGLSATQSFGVVVSASMGLTGALPASFLDLTSFCSGSGVR